MKCLSLWMNIIDHARGGSGSQKLLYFTLISLLLINWKCDRNSVDFVGGTQYNAAKRRL